MEYYVGHQVYGSKDASHHGVMGMKWGVRRYQNTDGSYKRGAEGRYSEASRARRKSSSSVGSGVSKRVGIGRKPINTTAMPAGGGGGGSSSDVELTDREKMYVKIYMEDRGEGKYNFVPEDFQDFYVTFGESVGKDVDKLSTEQLRTLHKKLLAIYGDENSKREKETTIKNYKAYENYKAKKEAERRKKELKHHGILGMKWGVRRYQNADGSLTPLGRRRLNRNIKYDARLASDRHEQAAKQEISDLGPNKYYSEERRGQFQQKADNFQQRAEHYQQKVDYSDQVDNIINEHQMGLADELYNRYGIEIVDDFTANEIINAEGRRITANTLGLLGGLALAGYVGYKVIKKK